MLIITYVENWHKFVKKSHFLTFDKKCVKGKHYIYKVFYYLCFRKQKRSFFCCKNIILLNVYIGKLPSVPCMAAGDWGGLPGL